MVTELTFKLSCISSLKYMLALSKKTDFSDILTGVNQIQQWLRESLERRLVKSLACDWMSKDTAHEFKLRQFYVQLEWEKKIRHALRTERVTLTSIHELIKQVTATGDSKKKKTARKGTKRRKLAHPSQIITNMASKCVLIEGKGAG